MKTVVLFLIILVSFTIKAQETDETTRIYPSRLVFEKFHDDMAFLNNCLTEIDKIKSEIDLLFNKKLDTIRFNNNITRIHQSFQIFTNFNAERLVVIDQNLASTVPIKGSDITYLHKSFLVYKNYDQLYRQLLDNIKQLSKKERNSYSFIQNAILQIKLSSLSFYYKNYYNVIGNKRLRRILNAGDASFVTKDNELKHLSKKFLSRKNYQSIKKLYKKLPNHPLIDSSLQKHILTHSYQKSRIKKDQKRIINFFWQDQSHKLAYFFSHHVSGFIGNTAGIFRFRKGYLYNNDSIISEIKKRLKPMDIITEKTGFTLTDKMIPGYFGHIAIWLGTEEQLKENHLWEHPVIVLFQNRIKQGYCILETDREGTHLKTLEDFMNIDELAIAGIKGFSDLTIDEKVMLYENALSQLGKGYDFNFDVETSDKLVCSELLYQTFGAIHWPTDSYLKRKTISPDNVLSLVLYQHSPIKLKYFIGAKNKSTIYTKSIDDLANNLMFSKKNNVYVIKGEKCIINQSSKKQCKTVYYPLEYR
jgi:hypothetical protein